MAKIKSVPQVYKTSDNEEFEDHTEAEKHQELLDARESYTNALQRYRCLLVESYKTADDRAFEFANWTYYAVIVPTYSLPRVVKLSFYSHGNDGYDWIDGDVKLVDYDAQGLARNNDAKPRSWSVDDLYYYEANAKKKLLEELIKFMDRTIAEVQKAKAENKQRLDPR